MASKEAIDYCKSIGDKDGKYYVCGNLEEVECSNQIMEAFDAGVEDIISLQKEIEALKEHNKWHRIDENSDDLPTEDKEYLVKVVFDVGTGNEHIFLAQWWNENKFWDSLYEKDIVAWKDPE